MALFNMQSKEEIELSSAAAAKSVYVAESTALCRVLGHYKMYLDTRDSGIVPHLLLDGYWESWVTYAVARMVRRRDAVVNVGASFGYYALLFADLVGPDGSVVAVEPQPDVFRLLERNRAVNGFEHLELRCQAAAANEGAVAMCRPAEFMNARVVPADYVPQPHETVVSSPALSLDQMVRGPVDLVFMDAEGSEPAVWDGMQGVRKDNSGLVTVLEFAPSRYPDPMGFAESLTDRGRRLFVILEETGNLELRTPAQIARGERPGARTGWGEEFMVVVQPP
jgi:FkbM family methyltransferase